MKKILIFIVIIFFSVFFYLKTVKSSPILSPTSSVSLPKIISQIIPTKIPTIIPPVSLGLVGDLGLGRFITSTARQKNDFSWSFSGVSSILQQNDFNLANLESPIVNDCPEGKTGTFTFCGDSRFLPQLKQNKFILNLANNHIFNYGQNGFEQTKKFLSGQDTGYVYSHDSSSEFYQTEINGIKFGILGFDLISNPQINHQKILNLISKYNSQVDWLIVSIHWGNEYLPQAESWRIKLAHQMIDVGADIIHGHHPHVLQPSEIYQNKPIFYSLGNFIFDQNWSTETSTSQIINLKLTKNEIINQQTIPLKIKYNSRPEVIN
ncbi:MAG: CapA family protein [Candidatus Shapirobacteria bacterium]|nr:CapA family protein [Candidatus Shapirobacteria bacterium]